MLLSMTAAIILFVLTMVVDLCRSYRKREVVLTWVEADAMVDTLIERCLLILVVLARSVAGMLRVLHMHRGALRQ